ncbi:hypothetical protein CVV38_02650 [Candidatus Peregrinibacteria bacterium HGW-Peregrinibacteria-1]|jgi:TRAP-type C4-dicarboxylate transport system permease small subunit|nr:MAG: hypothetical protein CVV38_02650 [Candidatus Peregrinibacteria bacterium HGW-Peregrinibacteria-1]
MKKQLIKIGSTIFLSLVITLFSSTSIIIAAQPTTDAPLVIESINKVGDVVPNWPDFQFGQHPDAPPNYGQDGIGVATSPIFFAIDLLKLVLGTIAFIIVVIAAISLVVRNSEEEYTKAKRSMIWGLVGLLVVQLADTFVRDVFFGDQGEILQNQATAELFGREGLAQMRGIIGFIEVFIGIIAVLVIIYRGIRLISSVGDENELTTTKRHLVFAVGGLILVILSEVIIRGVIFPDAGAALPDTQRFSFVVVGLANFMAGFIALFAFVMLVYGGYRYVTMPFNEQETEKVKKIVVAAIIGIIIAMGAFAFVNTVIRLDDAPDIPGEETPV